MKLSIKIEDWENELQLNRAFENVQWPEYNDRLLDITIDAPNVQKFVNCFLNSNLNAKVNIVPPSDDLEYVNYAGMFSGCRKLNRQPVFDGSKNRSMAAMFKNCENMRFNLHSIETSNVVDFRQCFWGAVNYSGNGPQYWNYSSARSPDAFRNFFGGGSGLWTRFYDQFIESLHAQMLAGTLPTPMSSVNMGYSQYSPHVAKKHSDLVDYGWEIIDGGEVPYTLSTLEVEFSRSVDSLLESGTFPGNVDFGPVCTGPRNGLLISPRHVLHVRHYMPSVGQAMPLISGETVIVERIDSGYRGLDIGIATLKEDAKTSPALVLPKNWQEAMPLLVGPPTHYPSGTAPALIRFKRGGSWTINDATFASTSDTANTGCTIPVNELRKKYFAGIQVGDSGSAVCFVYKNRLVASYSLATSGGTGIFLSSVRDWADAILSRTGHKFEEIQV